MIYLIYKISSTCFGQYFVHHQEREINKSLLHPVGSSVLLYLIDDARSNKNKFFIVRKKPHLQNCCQAKQSSKQWSAIQLLPNYCQEILVV